MDDTPPDEASRYLADKSYPSVLVHCMKEAASAIARSLRE